MKVQENEKPVRSRIPNNFWVDLASLIVMVGLVATGGLIHFILPAGSGHFHELFGWNRHDIGRLHFYLAVAAIALLLLHVLLHWSWFCCVVAKALGRESPSRRTQRVWGGGLLLGITILLVGGLWGAASLVRPTSSDVGERRRAYARSTAADLPRWPGPAEGQVAPQPTPKSPGAQPPEPRPSDELTAGRVVHGENCGAAAAINGRTSLEEAAKLCGLSVAQLIEKLRLPAGTNAAEALGRLKRNYGLDIHAVRRLACR